MKPYFRPLVAFVIISLCGLLGWWLVGDFGVEGAEKATVLTAKPGPAKGASTTRRPARPIYRDEFRDGTTVEIFASSRPDEVILRFPSEATYQAFFIALSKSSIRLVDQLDPLRALRLSYDDWDELSGLLDGENLTAYDSLPADPAPSPSGGGNQPGLVGFGDSMLTWLGIDADNSSWGAGVKIAVIDSGVVPHPDLPGLSQSISITPFPQDLSETYGHGTAVASLIAGSSALAPGVAPAAELISIRVGDESGKTDSFALAAGILAALDAKVQIMNISMGTTENNPLIEEAVLMARERDVLIVAASGNSEQDDACYPAAYPSVISVGSVDARGVHLDFSNFGSNLSLTAPGYSLNAAWPGNRYAKISGTSASAPIVTGAIAATMSNGTGVRMSASQAAEIIMKNSDEAGLPGPDSEFGSGILNMARVMSRGIPGIVDAAITDQRLVKGTGNGANDKLEVTVQNRGTSILINTLVEINTSLGSRQFNATTIAPGAIQTFSMPVRLSGLRRNELVHANSKITLGTLGRDVTPHNNHRVDTLHVP